MTTEELSEDGDGFTGNAMMREVWDGDVGRFWVDETERYERMNAGFGARLLSAAAPRPGERFLDIGCGHGGRSLELADAVGGNGRVVGVDLSGPMLEVARRRATERGLDQLTFRQADAQVEDLGSQAYDGVISQFGVMFFADSALAFANLRRTLDDGGRMAFTCWQDLGRQERVMVPVAAALEHVPTPEFDDTAWSHAAFSLADPDHTRSLLESAGFREISIEPVVMPEYQGRDVQDVVTFMQRTEMAGILFSRANPDQAAQGWEAISQALQPHASDDGVYLDGAAWLVKAVA